jgi:subtilisin family serine protease
VKCIKVLGSDGSGSLSGIVAGMDMVAQAKRASPRVPMVVNLSLGSGFSSTVNNAVSRLSSLGVMVVVAAGNEGRDASRTSPASATSAITVGASTTSDRRTSWSNYGSVVDVYAPGDSILSASYAGDSSYVRMSGTSMASPGVAGHVACVLGAAPGSRCSSSDTVVGKIRNPRVVVSQLGGSKPLAYVAEGSRVSCP